MPAGQTQSVEENVDERSTLRLIHAAAQAAVGVYSDRQQALSDLAVARGVANGLHKGAGLTRYNGKDCYGRCPGVLDLHRDTREIRDFVGDLYVDLAR